MPYRKGKVFQDDSHNLMPEVPDAPSPNDPKIVRWWPVFATLAGLIVTAGGWCIKLEYNVSTVTHDHTQYVTATDHRLDVLEAMKADQTAKDLLTLANTVKDLSNTVGRDHDLMVRVVTLLEEERKDKKQ